MSGESVCEFLPHVVGLELSTRTLRAYSMVDVAFVRMVTIVTAAATGWDQSNVMYGDFEAQNIGPLVETTAPLGYFRRE